MNNCIKNGKKALFSVLFLLSYFSSYSQVEMADQFRSDGKIYVVLAVISILLGVLFFLLFRLERMIYQLEKKMLSKSHE